MQVHIERLGKASFVARSRGHMLLCDQPVDSGGDDCGMTPPELLLSSLGTCVAYYVTQFCDTRRIACDDLKIAIRAETLHNPGRIGDIEVDINLSAELEEDRLNTLLRAVTHCTIHTTLESAPDIRVRIHTPAAVISA
jgi:uncharacterized OsmC-like protein